MYIFPEIKLRSLNPNFHIHDVSVSDLCIPIIHSQKHDCRNWVWGGSVFSWEYFLFQIVFFFYYLLDLKAVLHFRFLLRNNYTVLQKRRRQWALVLLSWASLHQDIYYWLHFNNYFRNMRANRLGASEGFKTVRCRLECSTSREKDLWIESFFFEKTKTSRRSYAAWYIFF